MRLHGKYIDATGLIGPRRERELERRSVELHPLPAKGSALKTKLFRVKKSQRTTANMPDESGQVQQDDSDMVNDNGEDDSLDQMEVRKLS